MAQDVQAAEAAWNEARGKTRRQTAQSAMAGSLFIPLLSVPAIVGADAISSGSARVLVTASLIAAAIVPLMAVMVHQRRKQLGRTDQLMQAFVERLNETTRAAEAQAGRSEVQVRRQRFETRLASALEMADGEPEVVTVIERALTGTLPDSPVELLLADNSHAHVTRMAFSSPDGEPPRCGVDSPDRCPAARRAQVQRFGDSEDLDACPKLRGRPQGPCSAVCVPVSIMGRTVGVIHATDAPGATPDEGRVAELGTLANLAGARIGLLRMMAETQLQAATDTLTGLLNRRALENEVRQLRADSVPFTLAMGDLDHFKKLNDVYGHDTGDRALRMFAQTLRGSLRRNDLVSRHGGEEFVVVLPLCDPDQARLALEGVRTRLRAAIAAAGLPPFTVSFGIVPAEPSLDLPEVIALADIALFQAKHQGRDRIVVHDEHSATAASIEPYRPESERGSETEENPVVETEPAGERTRAACPPASLADPALDESLTLA